MIREIQMRLLPQEAVNEQALRKAACRETGENPASVRAVRVLKRSIDARQRTVYVNVSLRLFIDEEPEGEEYVRTDYRDVSSARQVVVAGAGPAGLFAARRLIELGLKPVVVERGRDVRQRKTDIANMCREQRVDAESNYCFGEGGAGAFSDGKLYTRSKKRGSVERILNILCQHGADVSILSDAHPHIGTDRLPHIIENIRNTILNCGGEVHFSTCMTSLLLRGEEVEGINTRDGRTFAGPVILATGHSARDVYRWLEAQNVDMEAKGIAVGVRLEHPQALIDRIRYHTKEGRG
ncbi:MAG: FAD-binding protein, partial [Tannerella sp.]|nr:FAD-binding protein [Tannerella sp.]